MKNNLLIFDLFADFGQVKKVFTTMSPLSFPFLSRTALQGVLGAIIGIDKAVNPESFIGHNTHIGLRILNPVKKLVIPHNNIKVISKTHFSQFEQHKPTNIEFLKDVKYRIYFTTEEPDIYERLKENLENHLSVYTVTIGVSQCLANFEYSGEFNYSIKESKEFIRLDSVCVKACIEDIDFGINRVFTVMLPVRMKNDREVIEYTEYVYEADAQSLSMKINQPYIKISNGEQIVFL
jgi:CRISPR-associated protein Cas5h